MKMQRAKAPNISQEENTMDKNTFQTVKLAVGEIRLYDFGAVKLHAYQTGDPISDQTLVVEKNGQAVVIEPPCFKDSIAALEGYLRETGLAVAGVVAAYHMAGASFLKNAKRYATRNADAYGHQGGGKALIDNFAQVFGEAFDSGVYTVTDYLEPGRTVIGGVELEIIPTEEAFDIAIPEMGAVYTHMLGHDCHSIVPGPQGADAMIAQLESYLSRGFTLVLTSHYVPEDRDDVETKLAYLRELKAIASRCGDGESFRTAVKERFPGYVGENYLDMTAGFFFG